MDLGSRNRPPGAVAVRRLPYLNSLRIVLGSWSSTGTASDFSEHNLAVFVRESNVVLEPWNVS